MQVKTEINLKVSYFRSLNTRKKPVSRAALASQQTNPMTRIVYSDSRRKHHILQQLLGGNHE